MFFFIFITVTIFSPLLGAILGLFGSYVGRTGTIFFSSYNLGFVFLNFFLIVYMIMLYGNDVIISFGTWFFSDLFLITWTFRFTLLTAIMLFMVSFVAWVVHIYSCGYMGEDPFFIRFMSYISLFSFFMFLLVLGDNLLILLVGWEGVGICSFLLIGFWHTRVSTSKSAFKALLFNKIGDAGMLIALSLIFNFIGSLNFNIISVVICYLNTFILFFINSEYPLILLIAFFFIFGVMGKSAQIGLHAWLPDAMAGPTPVSALIHAATMVTAGVFLLIKCSFIFECVTTVLIILIFLGSLTIFGMTLVGVVQSDLKKIVAYSTSSQLGYMVLACGLSGYSFSFFHLFNHAFFKALLFLGAGVIIFTINGEQDIRKMGGLGRLLPLTCCLLVFGSLSLMGTPFLSGFYSKDLIIELAACIYYGYGLFGYFIAQFCAMLTAFYSIRIIYLLFITTTNFVKNLYKKICESSFFLQFPLYVLNLGGLFIGYFVNEIFVNIGAFGFSSSIFILPEHFSADFEFLDPYLLIIGLWSVIFGSLFYFVFFSKIFDWFSIFNILFINGKHSLVTYLYFFRKRNLFDFLYIKLFGYFCLIYVYNFFFKWIEKNILEFFGPFYISWFFYRVSLIINLLSINSVYSYIVFIICFLFISLGFSEIIILLDYFLY